MYQAPEVIHLERAVKAVRKALIPEKQNQPTPERETDIEAEEETDKEDHDK